MIKMVSPLGFALLVGTMPALASVTVTSPVNNATVNPTFALAASASPCSSQAISAMGYSFDNSSTTVTVNGSALQATLNATVGSHVLHVKSWGTQGASCVTNVSINVVQPITTPITNVAVSAPLSGATVTSPFAVAAAGSLCSSQPISAMGYSLDSSTTTVTANGGSIAGQLTATGGSHTVHIKSWGNAGASCVSDISVNVSVPPPPPPTISSPQIPSNAVAVNNIQNLPNWQASFDTATGGTAVSSGVTSLVATPSLSGSAREYLTTYSNYGGERYSVNIGQDAASENFVYDTQVYLASPINDIANIEMDMNQVLSNGQVVIFGFQCDGWSRTWDYTQNTGTPTQPNDQWMHSNQACNPQAWTPNTWHHVQVSYSRDSSGNVTYKSVWLDGQEQDLNLTVPSLFALSWSPGSLVTNFQIDGMTATSGSATTYMDNVTVYRW